MKSHSSPGNKPRTSARHSRRKKDSKINRKQLMKKRRLQTMSVLGIQAADMEVSASNNPHEQQADRVAEQVVNGPVSSVFFSKENSNTVGSSEKVHGLQAKHRIPGHIADGASSRGSERGVYRSEVRHQITRKTGGKTTGGSFKANPGVVRDVSAMKNAGGRPLPKSERAFLEPRFGRDLSHVRIHDDQRAQRTSEAIHAKAFTTGNHIAFNKGHYRPGTREGRKLLAHEITHTFQQTGGKTDTVSRRVIQRDLGYNKPTGKNDPLAIIPIEYFVQMVNGVERAYPGESPRDIVTRIRLLYYGGNRDSYENQKAFHNLIPDAKDTAYVDVGNDSEVTRDKVGSHIYNYLTARGNENAIGDNPSPYIKLRNGELIDIGHLFLGIDALNHPRTGDPFAAYDVPNIDPATWAADLGIAVVWHVAHLENEKPHPKAPKKAHEMTTPSIAGYYELSAPEVDLLGDVDAFGVKYTMEVLASQSLSEMLRHYYLRSGVASIERRWQTFARMNGFHYTGTGSNIQWTVPTILMIMRRVKNFIYMYNDGGFYSMAHAKSYKVLPRGNRNWEPWLSLVVLKFLNYVKKNLVAEISRNAAPTP